MELANFKSIIDLIKAFPTEQSCIDHLEILRWNGNVVSPFDATSRVYKCKNNRYRCTKTKKYFNVRTGTIFDNTKIPLQKWFLALYIFSSHKKGVSSHQLSKDITVTQKTAWFLLHRLRYAFAHPNFKKVTENVFEIDETFVGGEEKNKHYDKKTEGNQGRSTKTKKPILGILERGDKENPSTVLAIVVKDTKKKTIQPIVEKSIPESSTISTDEWKGYNGLKYTYKHLRVNHSAKEYVNGMAYTNGVENFWSHMKRGLDGIYHSVTHKHLQSYVDEYALRFNTRKNGTQDRFDDILRNTSNKRLTYKELIRK